MRERERERNGGGKRERGREKERERGREIEREEGCEREIGIRVRESMFACM